MLVIKVELHSANTGNVSTIGKAIIHNTGGTHKRGNYEVLVAKKNDVNKTMINILKKPLRKGTVTNYPRLSYNVWRLVSRALLEAFPEEKGVKTK